MGRGGRTGQGLQGAQKLDEAEGCSAGSCRSRRQASGLRTKRISVWRFESPATPRVAL